MNAYIYRAALLCAEHGEEVRREIERESGSSQQLLETGTDSEGYPQGPYPDGGGEADCPQHCDICGLFLENPLTEDGSAYVKSAWLDYVVSGSGDLVTLIEWRDGYPCEFSEFGEALEKGHYPDVPAVDKLEPKSRTRFELLIERT